MFTDCKRSDCPIITYVTPIITYVIGIRARKCG
jgi:hypothetical protein